MDNLRGVRAYLLRKNIPVDSDDCVCQTPSVPQHQSVSRPSIFLEEIESFRQTQTAGRSWETMKSEGRGDSARLDLLKLRKVILLVFPSGVH